MPPSVHSTKLQKKNDIIFLAVKYFCLKKIKLPAVADASFLLFAVQRYKIFIPIQNIIGV